MAGLIYSANFGRYDSPRAWPKAEEGVEYMQLVSDGEPGEDLRWKARQVKVMTPTLYPDYDWYLWIDSTMQIKAPLLPLIEKLLESKHDFAAFKHNEWQCAYREIIACLDRGKDNAENLGMARDLLDAAKLPVNFGQPATGILWRRNTGLVRSHARAWWDDMEATTMRDQCTFMLNLWKQKAYVEWIPGLHTENRWFKYYMGHLR